MEKINYTSSFIIIQEIFGEIMPEFCEISEEWIQSWRIGGEGARKKKEEHLISDNSPIGASGCIADAFERSQPREHRLLVARLHGGNPRARRRMNYTSFWK